MTTNADYDAAADLYEVMGVPSDATAGELRKAYTRLCLKLHPDKLKLDTDEEKVAATEKFTRMSNTYQVLKDPETRKGYDWKRNGTGSRSKTRSGKSYTPPPKNGTATSSPSSRKTTGSYENSSKTRRDAGSPFSGRSKPFGSSQRHDTGNASTSNNSNERSGYRGSSTHQSRQWREAKSEERQQRQRGRGDTPGSSSYNYQDYSRQDRDYNYSSSSSSGSPFSGGSSNGGNNSTPSADDKKKSTSGRSSGAPRWYDDEGGTSSHHHNYSGNANRGQSGQSESHQTVYGVRKDGEPCLRCQKQGRFCFQHTDQDPSGNCSRPGQHNSRQSSHSKHHHDHGQQQSRTTGGPPVYGLRKDGLPCKRCQQQGGYCHQHKDQDKKSAGSTYGTDPKRGPYKADSSSRSRYRHQVAFGIRQDGQPCQRCMKQQRFCFQHEDQKQWRQPQYC